MEISTSLMDSGSDSFEEKLRNSTRMLFSAKFGTGKTTFLRYVFEDNKLDSDYEAIFLSPVVYSIVPNSDILELIKFDIITELLSKYPDCIDNIEVDELFVCSLFLQEKVEIVSEKVVSSIKKSKAFVIAKIINGLIESKSFNQTKQALEEANEDFLRRFVLETNVSRYREGDIVGHIIAQVVKNIQNQGKKLVLIIDDVDRMDPGEVFRILNVFSVHWDTYRVRRNMFEFSNVIIVADNDNLKSIFHHMYGENTHYEGYIDKFYTNGIHKFTLANSARFIRRHLDTIVHVDAEILASATIKSLYISLIVRLYELGSISIRRIRENKSFLILSKKGEQSIELEINLSNINLLPLLRGLVSLYSDVNSVISELEKLLQEGKSLGLNEDLKLMLIEEALIILNLHKLKDNIGSILTINDHDLSNSAFEGKLGYHRSSSTYHIELDSVAFIDMRANPLRGLNFVNYNKLLIRCLEQLKRYNCI